MDGLTVPLFGRNVAVSIRHTNIDSIIEESNFMGVHVFEWKWVQSKWEIKNEMLEMSTQAYKASKTASNLSLSMICL